MPPFNLECRVCGGTHVVDLTPEQSTRPFVFLCPDLDRRYRLMAFSVETRRSLVDDEAQIQSLRDELGAQDFDAKLERWKQIKYPPLGLLDDYSDKLRRIIHAYSVGDSYPGVTGACCLGERILNRLVLRCRSYFKSHPSYKKIYRKKSFDDWTLMLDLISDWKLIPMSAISSLRELTPIRHESIHYNEGYDFEAVAPMAINHLISAVRDVFGVINRADIYLVFDVPGEVWVRSAAESLPFVKEFVLPHCYHAHAVHDIDFENGRVIERLGKTGPLTDNEFVELRKASMA